MEGVRFQDAYFIVGTAIVLAPPFFWIFGRLFARPQGTLATTGANAGKFVDAAGKLTVAQPEIVPLIFLVWIQVVFVTMVYGPIAAFLVEYFPARIRYTSLSIPYHLGNGWFGGFLSLIAAALSTSTGNRYAGLIYPITVAITTVIIGRLFIKESRHVRIWDEVGGHDDDRVAQGESAPGTSPVPTS